MKVPYTKSGKCGDVVWQRNRYGQICYPAFVPFNPRTPAQQAGRGVFAAVSARWRTLSQQQREVWIAVAWNKWSKPRLGSGRLPGFNYFVKVNVALVNRGEAQVDLPPGYPRKDLVRTRSTASLTSPGMNGTRWNASLPSPKAGSETGRTLLRYRSCTGVSPDYHRSNTLAGRFDLGCPPKRLRFPCRSQPPRCRGAPRGNSLTSTRNRGKRVVKKRHLGVASPGPPPYPLLAPSLPPRLGVAGWGGNPQH